MCPSTRTALLRMAVPRMAAAETARSLEIPAPPGRSSPPAVAAAEPESPSQSRSPDSLPSCAPAAVNPRTSGCRVPASSRKPENRMVVHNVLRADHGCLRTAKTRALQRTASLERNPTDYHDLTAHPFPRLRA